MHIKKVIANIWQYRNIANFVCDKVEQAVEKCGRMVRSVDTWDFFFKEDTHFVTVMTQFADYPDAYSVEPESWLQMHGSSKTVLKSKKYQFSKIG